MRDVLNNVTPSILVVQELASVEGALLFRDSVAGALNAPLALMMVGSLGDSYTAIFRDTTRLDSVTIGVTQGSVRSQPFAVMDMKSTGERIAIVTGHWKAGETASDETDRITDANAIRGIAGVIIDSQVVDNNGHLTIGTPNLVFAGDLNVYSSKEEAYMVLLADSTIGTYRYRLNDPINRPGDWHNNDMFTSIHTQSTRGRQFGGGVSGGLDDRFDQILVSNALLDKVQPQSYTAFGNDGDHFNDSINAQPNTAVSAEIAQALHDASDHLPVYVDFVFVSTSGVEEALLPGALDLSAIIPPQATMKD